MYSRLQLKFMMTVMMEYVLSKKNTLEKKVNISSYYKEKELYASQKV